MAAVLAGIAVVAPLAIGPSARAFAPAVQPADADELIAAAVRAMGGLQNIRAIRSLVLRGNHYEGSYRQELSATTPSNATMVRLRPNYRTVGCRPEIVACEGRWGRIVESYDGRRGWELNWPKQRLVRTVNKAERALRCGAELDPLFVDYAARGYSATFLGRQTLLGREALAITVTPPGCAAQTFYFDPVDFHLVMQRTSLPVHARGGAVDTVQVAMETTVVAGVTFTSRAEEVALADGRVLGGGAWTSIVANTVTEPAVFEAPATHPVGATKVALDMLASAARRDRPAVMMRIYDRWRRTREGPSTDSFYDLNWLGYELLQVDDYAAAIAVFRRLASDYPRHADACDSLGDAYLQQGDTAQARGAFDRALAIDPAAKETRRKRAALGIH